MPNTQLIHIALKASWVALLFLHKHICFSIKYVSIQHRHIWSKYVSIFTLTLSVSTTTVITIYFTKSNSVFRVIPSRSAERRTQTYSCICSGLPEHLRIEQKQWLQWKRMYSALFTLPKLRQYVLFLSLSLSQTHSFVVNRKDCNVQWWPQSSLNFSSHSLPCFFGVATSDAL